MKVKKNMASCENCGKTSKEVLLCNVISRTGIVKMCEACAKSEMLPIAKMPSDSDAIDFVISREPKPQRMMMQNRLIENFHWNMLMARRKTKLTAKQLGQELKEPEEDIRMLESGKLLLPADTERVISKVEQFFRIKLKKESDFIGSDLELAEDVFNEKV